VFVLGEVECTSCASRKVVKNCYFLVCLSGGPQRQLSINQWEPNEKAHSLPYENERCCKHQDIE